MSDKPLELSLSRVFDASPALLFKMWADPNLMRAWSCPHGFEVVEGDSDFRAGGSWDARMRGPDGEVLRLRGVYREIVLNERLRLTHAWVDDGGRAGHETILTVTFEKVGSRTRMTLHQAGFDSAQSRDGHLGGWSECLEKLEAHLKSVAARAA